MNIVIKRDHTGVISVAHSDVLPEQDREVYLEIALEPNFNVPAGQAPKIEVYINYNQSVFKGTTTFKQ